MIHVFFIIVSYGSKWTILYKPINNLETIENVDRYDEDKYTKLYMNKYGRNNVRGGTYCKVTLSPEQEKVLD
jgi:hypothetical protein